MSSSGIDVVTAICVCVCVCVCVVIPRILDVRLVDIPTEVTHEKGHTGFLHLPSAVLALIFLARKIQPFLSPVDREVDFCVRVIQSSSICWAFFVVVLFSIFFCEEKIQFVGRHRRFEVTK